MSASLKAKAYSQARTELRICEDPKSEEQAAFWWINGYRARLVLWTPDEWETDGDTSCGCAISSDGGLVRAQSGLIGIGRF